MDIYELRKIPFEDTEFVRFLKENKIYKAYVSVMTNEKSLEYQHFTTQVRMYCHRFATKKSYIVDGFPFSKSIFDRYLKGTNFACWLDVHLQWAKTETYKNAQ